MRESEKNRRERETALAEERRSEEHRSCAAALFEDGTGREEFLRSSLRGECTSSRSPPPLCCAIYHAFTIERIIRTLHMR